MRNGIANNTLLCINTPIVNSIKPIKRIGDPTGFQTSYFAIILIDQTSIILRLEKLVRTLAATRLVISAPETFIIIVPNTVRIVNAVRVPDYYI